MPRYIDGQVMRCFLGSVFVSTSVRSTATVGATIASSVSASTDLLVTGTDVEARTAEKFDIGVVDQRDMAPAHLGRGDV